MMESTSNAAASESVRNLFETYEGLEWDKEGNLDGSDGYLFVQADHDRDVKPPLTLPSIVAPYRWP